MPGSSPRLDKGHDLIVLAGEALDAVEALLAEAITKVRERVAVKGRIVDRLFGREQRATHGLAWLAAYVAAIRQIVAFAERLQVERRLGEIEDLLIRIGLGEYLAQIHGGIPMSQGETVRLQDLGLSVEASASR